MKSEIEHSVSQLKWNDTPKFNNNSPSLLWKHDSTVSTDVYLGRVTSIAYLKKNLNIPGSLLSFKYMTTSCAE